MFKRFSNTRARAPCNPRRGAVFAPKWAKKFCKPALRQLAKFRVHSRSSVIKNRALVSFSALSRLFALIRPTPSAFYHSSRKLTQGIMTMLPRRKKNPQTRMTAVRTVLEVPAPTILPVRILLAVPVVRTAVADKIRMPRTSPGPTVDRAHLRSSSLRAAVRRRPVMPGNLRCGVW